MLKTNLILPTSHSLETSLPSSCFLDFDSFMVEFIELTQFKLNKLWSRLRVGGPLFQLEKIF